MKNILWLTHLIPYPPTGGVTSRSFNLVKQLSSYNKIYMLGYFQRAMHPSANEVEQGILAMEEYCEKAQFSPIGSERAGYGKQILALKSLLSRDAYTINWLKNPSIDNTIKEWIERYEIDAVHFDTISLCVYKEAIGVLPSILNHHNIESHMMARRSMKDKNMLKRAYYSIEARKLKKYEQSMCPIFSINATCSPLDSIRLENIAPGVKTEVIPNGVDANFFRPEGIEQLPMSMIFVGGLTWYPNRKAMDFFVASLWPKIKESMPEATMTIVGRNPPDNYLLLTKEDPKFNVTGFVDDVRPIMESASVYVCPINDGGGTKLKILDALAMEKAIVAHPLACEGIDVVDGVHVLFAETTEEYLEKIQLLFGDASLRKKMGQNGRKLVSEKYSYEGIGKKLADTFSSII